MTRKKSTLTVGEAQHTLTEFQVQLEYLAKVYAREPNDENARQLRLGALAFARAERNARGALKKEAVDKMDKLI